MYLDCPCPHTCNNVWRGDGKCHMECNIPECNWDDSDCDGHLIGICRGNVTIENIETGGEIKGYCNNGANTERICENAQHYKFTLPWRIKYYSCKWIRKSVGEEPIPRPNPKGCHSLVKCVSDKWCQQDCRRRIAEYPEKCFWDERITKTPTKYPTKYPSKYPTKKTRYPTKYPTKFPTSIPTTLSPTDIPTSIPTTLSPTNIPTSIPTTLSPTDIPTSIPTTLSPTFVPTFVPNNPSSELLIPTPFPTHNTDDHHHHSEGMNKYDVAIAGIVICAIVIIVAIIIYYRRLVHKTHMEHLKITRLQRNCPPPMNRILSYPPIRGEPVGTIVEMTPNKEIITTK